MNSIKRILVTSFFFIAMASPELMAARQICSSTDDPEFEVCQTCRDTGDGGIVCNIKIRRK